MNILKVFDLALKGIELKTINTIYVSVDIHDTIIKGYVDYIIYLGDALPCLRKLTELHPLFTLTMWSLCSESKLLEYQELFKKDGINFNLINTNPRQVHGKIYSNIIIDDRSGFEPETDWKLILDYLNTSNEIQKIVKEFEFK